MRPDGQSAGGFEDRVKVVCEVEMTAYLDSLEEKVGQALKLIENIKGIDCIEECAKILEEVECSLY